MLVISKAILLAALGSWLAIALRNNLLGFSRSVTAIGDLMAMRSFDQEPVVSTPLTRKRVTSHAWHTAVLSFILVSEAATALLLLGAAGLYAGTLMGLEVAAAKAAGDTALAAFLALGSVMLIGGTWFGYYVKQAIVQLTHLLMLALGTGAAVLMNLPTH